MAFVIDASVTACWAISDEDSDLATAALRRVRVENALAPSVWWFEVRNTLIVNERRGRLSETETALFLKRLENMRVSIDRAPLEAEVLKLARRRRLTVYDAAYLELAMRARGPLATLDRKLAAAAIAESVPLIGTP